MTTVMRARWATSRMLKYAVGGPLAHGSVKKSGRACPTPTRVFGLQLDRRRREKFCSAGPRGLCGDLRVCGEAQQKAAGPRERRVALRYMPLSHLGALLRRARASGGGV